MSESRSLVILNLTSSLSEKLVDYFNSINAKVVSRKECEDFTAVNFILVTSVEQAEAVEQEFNCSQNQISIICIGEITNVKNFLISNGRLVINSAFAEKEIGRYLLNKYFQANFSIHLDESFQSFLKQTESVNIINHLSLGDDLDKISIDAFDNGFNIVSLRTFLDHTVYYLTYLKQAGLAGVPFAIEYGSNDENYFVCIHASVKNFVAEYMLESFGTVNTKRPLNFLLGIVAMSCDFLEVTYIEEPGKIVFTGIWNHTEINSVSGLMFNNIKTSAQTLRQLDGKIKVYQSSDENQAKTENAKHNMFSRKLPGGLVEIMMGQDPNSTLYKNPEDTLKLVTITLSKIEEYFPGKNVQDLSKDDLQTILGEHGDPEIISKLASGDLDFLLERVKNNKVEDSYLEEMERVRSKLKDDDKFKQVLGETLTEEVARRVTGHLDADTLNRILNGTPDEKEAVTLVKGSKEEADNFVKAINSTKDDHKGALVQSFSNALKKESFNFNVKISPGSANEPKKGLFDFLSSTVSSIDSMNNIDPNVRKFIKQKAPDVIQTKLQNFADSRGHKLEDLNEDLLGEFNETEMPNILEEVLSTDQLINDFKNDLLKGRVIQDQSEYDYSYKTKFEANLKKNLEKNLSKINNKALKEGKFNFSEEDVSTQSLQEIIKQTMHETIKSEYSLENASREVIEKKEKQIVEDLSASLKKQKEEVTAIIKGASEKVKEKEVEVVIENLFKDNDEVDESKKESNSNSTFEMNELMRKLKIADEQNMQLERKIQALKIKNESSEQTEAELAIIQSEAKKIADKQSELEHSSLNVKPMSAQEVSQAIEKVQSGQLTSEEVKQISEKFQADQQVIAQAQDNEILIRKMKIEAQQLNGMVKSELEKLNRALKAKEMVVEKIKSNTKALMLKKESEIIDLKQKMKGLSSRLNDDTLVQMKNDLSTATQNLKSLEKMNQIYKDKLDALSKGNNKNKAEVDANRLNEQVKSLSTLNSQLENKLKAEVRKSTTYQDRFTKTKESESKFRSQLTNAENLVKDHEMQIKKLKEMHAQAVKAAENQQTDPKVVATEISQLNEQNILLNNKVRELTEKLKVATEKEDGNKDPGLDAATVDTKTKNLEQGNKKLQQDLAKAQGAVAEQKKDFMKQKAENTALKNQIQALKKDLEKLKAESKKGKGSRAA